MNPFRIYADTSAIGGCHDPEFAEDSRRFIEGVRQGRFVLLTSEIVLTELQDAPEEVRSLLPSLPEEAVEPVTIGEEVLALRDAYRHPPPALAGRRRARRSGHRRARRRHHVAELPSYRAA